MMRLKFLNQWIVLILMGAFVFSCSDDDDPEPTTGIVKGIVTDGNSSEVLAEVRITLFDANTNQATDMVAITDVDGLYSFIVAEGSYYITLNKQGYDNIPSAGSSAIPFTVTIGVELDNPVQMFANEATDLGWITGTLTSSDASIMGSLVVAANETGGFSAISDSEGNYIIYNVTAGSYTVKAWQAGVNSPEMSAMVSANNETADIDLAVTLSSGTTVSGAVTFLATENAEVDVALTHPITKEAIPGLSTITAEGGYALENVPDGSFLARASYANDGIVMDPDWIVKNGEPTVTVSGANTTRDFSVTGAVSLTSPTNEASSTEPVSSSATPTFTWVGYSSTSDYVIQVSDANGNVIWGGFNADWTVKNITIPSSETSIEFNSDGMATESLMSGKIYRWSIYASKDNKQSVTGWELISVSEDQRGLIKIE